MKSLSRTLALLLSFSFVFPQYGLALDCPDGQEAKYNRCVKTSESLNQESRMTKCSAADNPEQCMKDLALKEANEQNDARRGYDDKSFKGYKKNSSGKGAITASLMGILAISAYVVLYWTKKKKLKAQGISCKSTDMTLLFSAAAAMLATEGLAYYNYQRDVKKAQNKFVNFKQLNEESDDYSEGGATQAYTLAGYNAIIEQEYAFREATEIRKIGYTVAAGAFAAAAVVSGLAIAQSKAAQLSGSSTAQYICPKIDVLKDKGEFSAKSYNEKIAAKKANKDGGMGIGGWMAIITPVLGIVPMLKSSSIELPSFNTPQDLIHNLKLDKKFYSMNQATTKSELDVLKQEREYLRSNKISSPSLKEFNQKSIDDLAYSEVFEEMKSAYLFGEAMDEKQEVFELLLENQTMAGL